MSVNKRQFYRIEYPIATAPRFEMGGLSIPVINLSEGGMAFRHVLGRDARRGQVVRGTIVFPDGTRTQVAGVISRVLVTRIAISFDVMMSLTVIMKEQRRMIRSGAGR